MADIQVRLGYPNFLIDRKGLPEARQCVPELKETSNEERKDRCWSQILQENRTWY